MANLCPYNSISNGKSVPIHLTAATEMQQQVC